MGGEEVEGREKGGVVVVVMDWVLIERLSGGEL